LRAPAAETVKPRKMLLNFRPVATVWRSI